MRIRYSRVIIVIYFIFKSILVVIPLFFFVFMISQEKNYDMIMAKSKINKLINKDK